MGMVYRSNDTYVGCLHLPTHFMIEWDALTKIWTFYFAPSCFYLRWIRPIGAEKQVMVVWCHDCWEEFGKDETAGSNRLSGVV